MGVGGGGRPAPPPPVSASDNRLTIEQLNATENVYNKLLIEIYDFSVCTAMCNVIENNHSGKPGCVMDTNTNHDFKMPTKKKPGLFGKMKNFLQSRTPKQNVPYKTIDLTDVTS